MTSNENEMKMNSDGARGGGTSGLMNYILHLGQAKVKEQKTRNE